MVVPHYCKQVFIFYLEMLERRFLAYDTVPTIWEYSTVINTYD